MEALQRSVLWIHGNQPAAGPAESNELHPGLRSLQSAHPESRATGGEGMRAAHIYALSRKLPAMC